MKPKPAPATPAATPLREANQQRVNAAAQRVRQDLYIYPADDAFRKDVELLIEIALAPVLEIFAAAQPAATPMAALNQRGWDLLRQMRHKLFEEKLISEDEYTYLLTEVKGSVKRLEDYDRAGSALRPAAAQPQRESEQPEQALREALQKFSDDLDAMRSTMPREALQAMDYFRRSLDDILEHAALAPQTDSQEPR